MAKTTPQIKELESGSPPIGSIMAWTGGYFTNGSNAGYTRVLGSDNTVAAVNAHLDAAWRVCDGTELNDASSPIFNGASRHLPNLTDGRFLRGYSTTGTANAGSITVSVPGHYHSMGTGANLSTSISGVAKTLDVFSVTGGSHTHDVNYYWYVGGLPALFPGDNELGNVAGSSASNRSFALGSTHSHTISASTNIDHTHTSFGGSIGLVTGGQNGNGLFDAGLKSATENLPTYLNCFYIMRVH